MKDRGVDDAMRQWFAKPVSTSHIVILATANALGYFRKEREEDGVDQAYARSWDHDQVK